jgi:hypothetical protein
MKKPVFKNEITAAQNERTNNARQAILWVVSFMAVVSIFLMMTGCTPKRQQVATYWGNTPGQALLAARLHAIDVNGVFYTVAPTGSMRPTLEAGDYVVVKAIDFQKLQPGMMVNYQARWLRPTSPTAVHWCVRKYGDEWVMDGENNKNYENTKETMMGKKEFRGIVVAIYTTRPSP